MCTINWWDNFKLKLQVEKHPFLSLYISGGFYACSSAQVHSNFGHGTLGLFAGI